MRKQFEYNVQDIFLGQNLEKILNEYGQEGWGLCMCYNLDDKLKSARFVFKRDKRIEESEKEREIRMNSLQEFIDRCKMEREIEE